jgi:glucose-6-phosphate 1-dehydrogenase
MNPETKTETYFSLKAKINTPKWSKTNFYLSSGKALNETITMIDVVFK